MELTNRAHGLDDVSWYAVSVRSRHEKVAARMLENSGITTFLPTVTEMHRWTDRRKVVDVPLFSCYLFVRTNKLSTSLTRVLSTPGVLSFVGGPRGPIPIPDHEIASVHKVSENFNCSPYPFLKIGERVRIVGGSMDGVEGTLVGRGRDSKLVISIELIQRSLAVSVYDLDIQPASTIKSAA